MKIFVIFIIIVSITGCGFFDKVEVVTTGYSRSCVDGVEYLIFANGASVAYTPSGKVRTCGN